MNKFCIRYGSLLSSIFALSIFHMLFFLIVFPVYASDVDKNEAAVNLAVNNVVIGDNYSPGSAKTASPDLFTGAMMYQFPLDVPTGRNGMHPTLALTYNSNNEDGWLGVGWKLELGAIQRATKNGVSYSDDNYQYIAAGSNSDLSSIGGDEYRLRNESSFSRIKKLTATVELPFWEVTSKDGTRFYYGQSAASRQDNPDNTNQIFKWCLDRVEDPNGNYMTISYTKDQGEIYPSQINYTFSNGIPEAAYTVKFNLETRSDAYDIYKNNFKTKTAYRLNNIEIIANNNVIRTYHLSYLAKHTLLSAIQQTGSDGTTSLPPVTFNWNADSPGTFTHANLTSAWCDPSHLTFGDFNGDGKTDMICNSADGRHIVAFSNGDGTFTPGNRTNAWCDPLHLRFGDFNGDGKTDMSCNTADGRHIVAFSNGDGSFSPGSWTSAWCDPEHLRFADFNGDGRTDMICNKDDGRHIVAFSNGDGTFTPRSWFSGTACLASHITIGDFNGDGKADMVCYKGSKHFVALSSGDGSFTYGNWSTHAWCNPDESDIWYDEDGQPGGTYSDDIEFGDFNGDGKTDMACIFYRVSLCNPSTYDPKYCSPIPYIMAMSKGDGTFAYTNSIKTDDWSGPLHLITFADYTGDGKTDMMYNSYETEIYPPSGYHWLATSKGDGTFTYNWDNWGAENMWCDPSHLAFGDFNGDGKTDMICNSADGRHQVAFADGGPINKLVSISNGLGGTIAISYTSSNYKDSQIFFPVHTVSAITTNDGNGNTSTTTYSYSGGYYYPAEKDFRGFNYVKVTAQAGPSGEQKITETWFHQGNDTAVDINIPKVATGYMKGKPYRVRISDENGHVIRETETTYAPQGITRVIVGSDAGLNNTASTSPWYFNPPARVDTYTCDGNSVTGQCKGTSSARHTRTDYAYDRDSLTVFGNLSHEYHYGDVDTSNDDLTIHRTYAINESKWMVGLPASEQIFQGIGTSAKVAETTYYYDGGVTDCATASTNQYPDRGLLTRTVRWLHYDGEPDAAIEERMAYDSHGNPVCRGDGRNYISTIGYDPSGTFPVSITSPPTTSSPSGLVTTTKYYGVNAVTGLGLYGQTQSITDPNNAITSYEYDPLGRQKKQTLPDGTWTSWAYNNFGIAGAQHVRTDTSDGRWTESYFDGFGRTVQSKTIGPDSKVIATDTVYDSRGAVRKTSFPYFYGSETPRYMVTDYDSIGRVTRTGQESPAEAIRTLICYNNDVIVKIDPNNHRRREVRDVNGRLTTVQEYKGIFASCDTDPGTPYATTTYQYDVLGNLRFVTDAKGNRTEMRYDSAGRKRYMSDPDMGIWTYVYDNGDNLVSRTDANKQTVTYGYDSLNRNTFKQFGASAVVTNFYDEATSGNSRGRLSRMVDGSGQTMYHYDTTGRITGSVKTVSGASYTLGFAYVNGRLDKITYPDNDTVSYVYYGDGNLKNAGAYVTYSNYDALGRPGNSAYGTGGASSLFTYDDITKRLKSISVLSPNQGLLFSSAYDYDNKGNLQAITDNLNKTLPTDYSSESYSIYPGKAHAPVVTGRSFQYDANGNMTGNGLKSITYDFDNMPLTIGNVSFTYDGNGARVRKSSPGVTTNYIDKLYECTNGVCVKYIYAGDKRVALKSGAVALYFHPDHQGSTAVVTDALGNLAESISYYPFGQTRQDNSPFSVKTDVKHKYTGQELDSETGFYNYGARLYDPGLARFLTPDSLVPDPENPQSFNRYAYVQNNPLKFSDPTGHFEDDELDTNVKIIGYLPEITVTTSRLLPENEASSNDDGEGGSWGASGAGFGYSGDIGYHPTFASIERVNPAEYSMTPWAGPFDFIGPGELKLAGGLLIGGGIKLLGKEAALEAYQVGIHESLSKLSVVGDDLALHHVGQAHPMGQILENYTRKMGVSIALPTAEHVAIPTIKGSFNGSARSLLAQDIINLRNYTNTPNSSLQMLIQLNKELFPEVFLK